jgi:cell division protein FtsI (penicillin-binding protein 3)
MNESESRSDAGRLFLVIGIITVWGIAISARLVYLHIFQHEHYLQEAALKQLVNRIVLPPRGVIYDSHMDELATSVKVNTVVAEPRRIKDIPKAVRALSRILQMNPKELLEKMKENSKYLVLKRRIDPKLEPQIEALDMPGVYLMEESMRVYPNRNLASQTLGFVNMIGDGSAGLEQAYDKELKGEPGEIHFEVDANRRSFRGTVKKPPVQGHSLVLSLDRGAQHIAERELAIGVQQARAQAGTAIVLESDTGRILALANYPDFNGNSFGEYPAAHLHNRAVSDAFEPGSTFKVVVAAAALEAGLTRPDEYIDCQMGILKIAGHIFHDVHRYGALTFLQVLEHSSNIGAAKLGMRLGEQRLYEALRTFGFGSKTGVDLPAEAFGLVRNWKDWSALSVGAISFGQEVGVTSLQILCAINSIANGGYLTRPSVVDRIINQDGDLVRFRAPERTRIMNEKTAKAVQEAFEGVVLRGTGKTAALRGYRSAGKTGTAQKIVNRRYSDSKYVASFIGFAPLPNPRITVLVQLDEPQSSIFGGAVSGPIFSRIAQQVLMRMRVPPDNSIPMPQPDHKMTLASVEDYIPNGTPLQAPGELASLAVQPQDDENVVRLSTGEVVMPDFQGMSKRQVADRCIELGIHLKADGSGSAVYQTPAAGAAVSGGSSCSVRFARVNAASGGRPASQNAPHSSVAQTSARP